MVSFSAFASFKRVLGGWLASRGVALARAARAPQAVGSRQGEAPERGRRIGGPPDYCTKPVADRPSAHSWVTSRFGRAPRYSSVVTNNT